MLNINSIKNCFSKDPEVKVISEIILEYRLNCTNQLKIILLHNYMSNDLIILSNPSSLYCKRMKGRTFETITK